MAVWTGRSEITVNAIWRLLWRLALVGILLYAGYRLRAIIATIFVAAIFAYVLDPMVEWLSRRPSFVNFHSNCANVVVGFQRVYRSVILGRSSPPAVQVRVRRHAVRTYATLYVFVLACVVLWYGGKLVVTPFVAQFRAATSETGQQEMQQKWEKFRTQYDAQAPDWGKSEKVEKWAKESNLLKGLEGSAGEIGKNMLGGLKYVVEIVLLPVLAFYFLIDGHKLKREFVGLVPRSRLRESLRVLHEFNEIMRSFIAGQFILCLLAGVVVGIGLAALKVPYALILGVLAGVTRAIPIVGPIIGGIPIILLTWLNAGFPVALGVLGFFTFLHFAESKFIMPLLIGDRMELHPVVIIVVLIVGGEVGGMLIGGQIGVLLGMFFAAPLAAIARVLIRRYWLRIREKSSRPPGVSLTPTPVHALPVGLPETAD
jgi:predicted PurR-regulated permease PerM